MHVNCSPGIRTVAPRIKPASYALNQYPWHELTEATKRLGAFKVPSIDLLRLHEDIHTYMYTYISYMYT